MAAQMATPHPQIRKEWPTQGQWTFEDWLRLPDDGFRYEVLNGELYMSPPPSIAHQGAVSNLLMWMRKHALDHHVGTVLTAPVGVRLPGQEVPIQPDIVFISQERSDIIGSDYINGAPDLVAEVLSPSNWLYDRGRKQEVYRQAGVREYWIVDYRTRTVEVLLLEENAYVLQGQFQLGGIARSAVLKDFAIALEKVFA